MAQVVTLVWSIAKGDADAAYVARREFGEQFARKYEGGSDRAAAELVFGELVSNAVEHADCLVNVTAVLDGVATLTIKDDGAGFTLADSRPPTPDSERGRGLYIASVLADELTVQRIGANSVVTAVLRPTPKGDSETGSSGGNSAGG